MSLRHLPGVFILSMLSVLAVFIIDFEQAYCRKDQPAKRVYGNEKLCHFAIFVFLTSLDMVY